MPVHSYRQEGRGRGRREMEEGRERRGEKGEAPGRSTRLLSPKRGSADKTEPAHS